MKFGWLSTGRDAAARNLLADIVARAAADGIGLQVGAVFCDRERGESAPSDLFHDLVADLAFPLIALSSAWSWERARSAGASRQAWRVGFHDQVGRLLEPFGLDVLVLAGYMLIVSPAMCARYAMLNLHPALPGGPTGSWQEVIWALLEQRAHETGAMIHLVTPELDRGPVVAFDRFRIDGEAYAPLWRTFTAKVARNGLTAVVAAEGEAEPLFAAVRRRGEAREIPLLYRTVKQFAVGHLEARGGAVCGNGIDLPVDLSAAVDAELESRP